MLFPFRHLESIEEMVSVIITCYNYGKYLANCVESALRQSHRDIEIIVINDGSTDNSDEVMQGYLTDPRIRYIKQNNAGQANAKNTGIHSARGDLIAFLDADDCWDDTKLEKQLVLFDDPAVGVVFSRARFVDEQGKPLKFQLTGEYLTPRAGMVTPYLVFDNFIPFSSSVVRKQCLARVGQFDESLKMGIDWDLWLRISIYYAFAFVDEPLLVYRLGHSGQMSKNLEERQRCSDRIIGKFLKKHPNAASSQTVRDALIYTYGSRAYYYSAGDIRLALRYYVKSLMLRPLSPDIHLGVRIFANFLLSKSR